MDTLWSRLYRLLDAGVGAAIVFYPCSRPSALSPLVHHESWESGLRAAAAATVASGQRAFPMNAGEYLMCSRVPSPSASSRPICPWRNHTRHERQADGPLAVRGMRSRRMYLAHSHRFFVEHPGCIERISAPRLRPIRPGTPTDRRRCVCHTRGKARHTCAGHEAARPRASRHKVPSAQREL
jgi:hypothetical protein